MNNNWCLNHYIIILTRKQCHMKISVNHNKSQYLLIVLWAEHRGILHTFFSHLNLINKLMNHFYRIGNWDWKRVDKLAPIKIVVWTLIFLIVKLASFVLNCITLHTDILLQSPSLKYICVSVFDYSNLENVLKDSRELCIKYFQLVSYYIYPKVKISLKVHFI